MTYYIWPDGVYCLADEYNCYDYGYKSDDFEIAHFDSEDALLDYIDENYT